VPAKLPQLQQLPVTGFSASLGAGVGAGVGQLSAFPPSVPLGGLLGGSPVLQPQPAAAYGRHMRAGSGTSALPSQSLASGSAAKPFGQAPLAAAASAAPARLSPRSISKWPACWPV
jgi:hypothetical protein